MLIFVQESQQYSIAQINALNGTHNLKKKLKWVFFNGYVNHSIFQS